MPGELNLTANGEQMRVRYPEGFRSIVDADLWLRGTTASPIVGGLVTVQRRGVDPALRGRSKLVRSRRRIRTGRRDTRAPTFPIRFDIEVNAPSSLRIENNIAHVVSSAELKLQGTYDQPLLFGRAEIERGDIVFEGNRYVVTRGSIDFLNPGGRIEPLFDIEAETRVRVPQQTYRVTLNVNGTPNRFSLSLGSDPPLPEIDIVGLLFGQTTDVENAELRALRPAAATESKEALIRAAGARLIASPISAPVRRVVEETLGLDTAQVTPTIGTENDPLLTSARLILGKRLSPRAFLTFSRALGRADRDQIIVLEYDQSDGSASSSRRSARARSPSISGSAAASDAAGSSNRRVRGDGVCGADCGAGPRAELLGSHDYERRSAHRAAAGERTRRHPVDRDTPRRTALALRGSGVDHPPL